MSYTKGEWKVKDKFNVVCNGNVVASTHSYNANLIAAAPEMYELIKREYAKGHISKKEADIILAKAEGR